MKVLDEKGKLFGIINVIDLAVVLVLALIVIGGVTRMREKPIVVAETSTALITYEVSDIRDITVNNILVGDELYHYDKNGFVGTIVAREVEPYREPIEHNGQWVSAEVPGKYVIRFTVESEVRNNPDVVVVGGEHTRIGIQYRMKNKNIAFFGTAIDIEVLE